MKLSFSCNSNEGFSLGLLSLCVRMKVISNLYKLELKLGLASILITWIVTIFIGVFYYIFLVCFIYCIYFSLITVFQSHFIIKKLMSLLDQLSSFCTTNTNYKSSFSNNYNEPQSPKQRSYSVSAQKTIKLFDDNELNCRFRSNKKSQSKQSLHLTLQDKNAFDKNEKSTRLTKMSYFINNKVRKINYEFFIRLQKYGKLFEKQQNQVLLIKQQNKLLYQKGFEKLSETINILHLKYYQTTSQQNQIYKAFHRLYRHHQIYSKFQSINKKLKKAIFKNYTTKLQKIKKFQIKLDLIESTLNNVINKRIKLYKQQYFDRLKRYYRFSIQTKTTKQIVSPPSIHPCRPLHLNLHIFPQVQMFTNQTIQTKSFISIQCQTQNNNQNIPLQCNIIKSHEQQINLNDCVDNGHLLMNQLRKNVNLKQELDNLTISKIATNTNTSLNSSALIYQNFILPQFNYQTSQHQIKPKNSLKKKQPIDNKTIRDIKKPRSSLVVTRRKQSIINSYDSSKASPHSHNKNKSTTNSGKKSIYNQQDNQKQNLKRMLQQLNKKYLIQTTALKKTIQINNSSSKKSTMNRQSTQNSSFNRKKFKSQYINVSKNQNNQIDYMTKVRQKQKAKSNLKKNSDNCFMSVTLNQNQTIDYNSQKQERIKQTIKQIKRLIPEKTTNTYNSQEKNSSAQKQNRIKIDLTGKTPKKQELKLFDQDYSTKKFEVCQRPDKVYQPQQDFSKLGQITWKKSMKMIFNDNQKYPQKGLFNTKFPDRVGSALFFTDETSQINKYKNPLSSSSIDSAVQEYINFLPSNTLIPYNDQMTSLSYISQKASILGQAQTKVEQSFQTGSRVSLSGKAVRQSLDIKRKSFQKSVQQWDMMFQKQKNKFIKKQPSKMSTSNILSLNGTIITDIKQKIEKCILGNKDTNSTAKKLKPKQSIMLKPYFDRQKFLKS